MQPDLPPGRYDPPRRRSRILAGAVAGGVAVAALTGGYALFSRYQAARLAAQLQGFDVTSDSRVRVSFEVVTRGHRGECKVRARDRSGAETGSQLVEVAPSGRRSQLITVDVATRQRAVTGELVGCRPL